MEETVIKILDHGHVALVDVFGDDARIARTARGSYGKGTKTVNDDRGLIRRLMKDRHTSPFEMGEVLFHLKIPIFVARQLVRHRTANINEVSARYSELPNEFYIPEPEHCGPQSTDNKQGRTAAQNDIKARKARQNISESVRQSYDHYDSLLNVSETSREISRIVLPTAIYTEMYWKCDLHNFFHFSKLRLDPHAQYEIRVMARAMFDLVRPHFPIATTAFDDYIQNAKTFSAMELKLFAKLLNDYTPTEAEALALGMSKREHKQFCEWIAATRATKDQ